MSDVITPELIRGRLVDFNLVYHASYAQTVEQVTHKIEVLVEDPSSFVALGGELEAYAYAPHMDPHEFEKSYDLQVCAFEQLGRAVALHTVHVMTRVAQGLLRKAMENGVDRFDDGHRLRYTDFAYARQHDSVRGRMPLCELIRQSRMPTLALVDELTPELIAHWNKVSDKPWHERARSALAVLPDYIAMGVTINDGMQLRLPVE